MYIEQVAQMLSPDEVEERERERGGTLQFI
jgi:hypothetical protein